MSERHSDANEPTTESVYRCEYCDGVVRPKRVEREAFKHKNGFIILEDVLVGVCDRCGSRYYSAATLRRVHEIASGQVSFERTEPVPVADAGYVPGIAGGECGRGTMAELE